MNQIKRIRSIGLILILGLCLIGGGSILVKTLLQKSKEPIAKPIFHKVKPGVNPSMGPIDAKHHLAIFSNYTCQPCQEMHRTLLPTLYKDYVDKGALQIFFYNPANFKDTVSFNLAKTAKIAHRKEAYFQIQENLYTLGNSANKNNLTSLLRSIGIDSAEVNQLWSDSTIVKEIYFDNQESKRAGVPGTPSFVLDGKLLEGLQPVEVFHKAIQD